MIPNADLPQALPPTVEPAGEPPAARAAAAPEPAASIPASPRASQAGTLRPRLEVVFERTAEPTERNPLTYREVAYFAPRGVSVPEAEAALRFELAELQVTLATTPRGKLVNLAAFDHQWEGAPQRPPIVALQWRDWRPEVVVDYPAARLSSRPPPPPSTPSSPPARHDDRLDDAFHGLAGLSSLVAPVEALDLAVALLANMVPCEAITAALYDINNDVLRFVSVYGTGAETVQGKAVPRSAGLLGQALRDELKPSLFGDVLLEAGFNAEVDSRPGVDARSMLVGPISNEGHLLGALLLINRSGSPVFSQGDASVLGYVAERLSEFLSVARRRTRSEPPKGSARR